MAGLSETLFLGMPHPTRICGLMLTLTTHYRQEGTPVARLL